MSDVPEPSDRAPASAGPDRMGRAWAGPGALALAALVFVATIAAAHRFVFDLGLLGWDTLPIAEASRIESFDDLLGTVTEELMDGRYMDGHFYRPVKNLVFAVDYALWGLNPTGWHLTDLGILLANALLVFALTRRLFGREGVGAWLGGLLAGLVILLHPVQIELLPVAARRGDTLSLTFLLACLLAQGRRVLPFVLALACVGVKEAGAVVAPVVLGWQFLVTGSAATGLVPRLAGAARRSLHAFAAVAVYTVARFAVLGGVGGHPDADPFDLGKLPGMTWEFVLRVLYPQPLFTTVQSASWFLAAVLGGLALGAVGLLLFSPRPAAARSPDGTAPGAPPVARALGFLAFWLLCLLGIHAISGRVNSWYAMLFAAPYACLLGALVRAGWGWIRGPGRAPRVLAAPALLLPLVLLGSHAWRSPLCLHYVDWDQAQELFGGVQRRIEARMPLARPGDVVPVEGFVPILPRRTDGPGVRNLALMSDYTIAAWCALAFPGRAIEVGFHPRGATPPGSDGGPVRILLVPEPPPRHLPMGPGRGR